MDISTTLSVTESGSRLDRYVAQQLPALSRAAVQRLIDDAQIRVDGIARKASYRVQAGDTISVRVPPPDPSTSLGTRAPRAENIPLDIIYEDDDLIVVNKPAGLVVHPAAGHAAGTLVNAILAHCPHLNVGGVERPGIVHRLDSDTSGIIVVAKNDAAMRDLQAQFKSRRVHKTYLALVDGHVKPPRGKIDAPIGRDPKHRQKMAVLTRGKAREAVTVYRTLAALGRPSTTPLHGSAQDASYTLIEAEPQTGRTHQIRVHLAFLGFPVVADRIYGSKTPRSSAGKKENALGLTRQFLHAWKIEFTLPREGRAVSFTAPLPEDLREVLEELGFSIADL
jgi:23S rRNA pseudouridine1911/1915/1917 synthase